jgi:hypothetical protein
MHLLLLLLLLLVPLFILLSWHEDRVQPSSFF